MTPEEREAYRRADARRRRLRGIGRPSKVYAHEHAEAVARLVDHRRQGMTLEAMEEASEGAVKLKAFSQLMCGHVDRMYRSTYDVIMAMPLLVGNWRNGSRVPAVGAIRRLQALRYAGWPIKTVIAPMLGMDPSSLQELSLGQRDQVAYETHMAIADLYQKLHVADPADHGVSRRSSTIAKAAAAKAGMVPASCWDADTIDDPGAVPEWTGACGTPDGRAVHRREGIPMCAACRNAKGESFRYGEFDPKALARAMLARHVSHTELAEATGLTTGSIGCYTSGRRAPSTQSLEKIADALRVRPEVLVK